MKFHTRAQPLAALACMLPICIFAQPEQNHPPLERAPSADAIVADVMRQAQEQRLRLDPYSVTRRYTVQNGHLKRDAVLQVLWTYEPGKGKRFQVVSESGVSGLTRRSLMRVLETEAKDSHLDNNPSQISPDHYQFELAGPGQNDYKLRLKPWKKSKYLLDGYAFVAKQDSAIVRVEGRTSKRLSFWVSEADITQEFVEAQGFWLPYKTHSSVQIRFVGKTELVIEAGEYHFLTPNFQHLRYSEPSEAIENDTSGYR